MNERGIGMRRPKSWVGNSKKASQGQETFFLPPFWARNGQEGAVSDDFCIAPPGTHPLQSNGSGRA